MDYKKLNEGLIKKGGLNPNPPKVQPPPPPGQGVPPQQGQGN
jgi:hypothetical protein